MKLIRAVETHRIKVINQVIGSVIAIYGPNQQGGGSGVIIEPNGIALTNHHVIQGAGLRGKGGLSDGNLYDWDLIGTDPGGDVAIIKLKGKDGFPYSPLGDSDQVRVGDWALAMGNPFLLAHDHVPTVTLGIVSGVQRFQEGMGQYQLVYGNCIQIDSSINPGNSGGPLFNMNGEVIGINGRGSFRDRGRVNVGLGYAISSNQIKNFIPDLLATKIVEHGTLDASFSNRGGKVVCSTINLDAPVAQAGLELGDRLIEFEGQPIQYANQFKNLICTLPEDWPARLVVEKSDGSRLSLSVRLFGLPYNFDQQTQPGDDEPNPEDEKPKDNQEDPQGKDAKPENDDGEKSEKQPDDKDNDQNENEKEKQKDQPKGESELPRDDQNPGRPRPGRPGRPQPSPEQAALRAYLVSEPGVVLDKKVNQTNLAPILNQWRDDVVSRELGTECQVYKIDDVIWQNDKPIGQQTIWIATDGRFQINFDDGVQPGIYGWDGESFWEEVNGERVKLRLILAKTNPIIAQAMCLIAPLMEAPLAPFGEAILDGGDKAQGQLAYRVMFLDKDEDWFYCWLSIYDESGEPRVRPLKASADKDCGDNSPGITTKDWRDVNGIHLPYERALVEGLAEQILWTAKTQNCSQLDSFDDSLFALTPSAPGDANRK